MSIKLHIRDCVRRQMLFPITPKARGTSPRRAMFVIEEVWRILQSPEGDDAWEQRVANLQADLEVFANGDPISPKYLFLLYPSRDCVWEIRSTDSDPSIRVLGLFAARNVFLATGIALREELGGWQSREWKRVKRNAGARWRGICLTYEPMRDIHARRLVSGAIDGKYFKDRGDP